MIGTAPGSLARAREAAGPALREAVARLHPEVRRVAEYHLGFADATGAPVAGDGGKAVRPTLAMLAAEAVGRGAAPRGASGDWVPGAVAIELVHDFSLLHDDVMDRDRERRHRPTAWALFGEPAAIVTGDALMVAAQQELLGRSPTPARCRATAELTDAAQRMIAGQALDLAFESRTDVTVRECMAMLAGKTGALLSCACALGAILAGGAEPAIDALRSFGLELGLAFQAIDDLLGIWGDPEVTGKPAANDLRQHKKSLPVVAALDSGTEAGRALADLLAHGALTEDQVQKAATLVEEAGGRAFAQGEAERRIDAARTCLERADLDGGARTELLELAAFVTGRDF